ncbi:MAG: MerR family transcriptional regulator [Solirubrobacteraceae bacterium]
MSTTVNASPERSLRIGEVAELAGTTTRTVRYYEEIGLLPGLAEREHGKHRCYSEADVERLREVVRLKELLGLSLEQLSKLVEAETARADLRREYRQTEDSAVRQRILDEALGHIANQLELVRERRRELETLEEELLARRRLLQRRIKELI